MAYSHPQHLAPRAHWVLPGIVWWGNLTGCAGSVVTQGRFVGSCMQLCTQVCLWHSPVVPPAHAHFLAQRRPRTIFISVQGLSPNHSSFRTSFCCCMLSWASSCWLFPSHPLVLEVPHHTSYWESWGTCLCLLGPQAVGSIPRTLSDSLGLPEPTDCGIRQRPAPTQRRGQGTLTKEFLFYFFTFLFEISACFSWRSSETIP